MERFISGVLSQVGHRWISLRKITVVIKWHPADHHSADRWLKSCWSYFCVYLFPPQPWSNLTSQPIPSPLSLPTALHSFTQPSLSRRKQVWVRQQQQGPPHSSAVTHRLKTARGALVCTLNQLTGLFSTEQSTHCAACLHPCSLADILLPLHLNIF